MELGDIIIAVAALYGAYKIGQWSIILPIATRLRDDIKEGKISLDDLKDFDSREEDSEEEQAIRVERHPEGYFAYSAQGDFMANGPSLDEMFTRFKARYPGGAFRIVKNPDWTEAEREQLFAVVKKIFGEEKTA